MGDIDARLFVFPILVLVVSILIGGGGILGPGTAVAFSNQGASDQIGSNIDCSNFVFQFIGGTGPCLTALPAQGTILCNQDPVTGNSCYILSFCPPSSDLVAPLWCNPVLGKTFLQPGASVTITNGQATQSKSLVSFAFGGIGPAGFIAMIGVVVAVAAVIGLNVFGSGESSEAIHALLMGGIFMGIWLFFSGLEGFVGGAPNSFFTQLNGAISNLGTASYVLLTGFYLFGFVRSYGGRSS